MSYNKYIKLAPLWYHIGDIGTTRSKLHRWSNFASALDSRFDSQDTMNVIFKTTSSQRRNYDVKFTTLWQLGFNQNMSSML